MRALTLIAASLLLAACSASEPLMPSPVPGSDRDSHRCIDSAGYQWSPLANQCVRLFELGVRLSPADASQTSSAFVLFNTDQSLAELHLPNGERLVLTRQGAEGNWSWQGGEYTLFQWKGYVLKSGDQVLYQGK